MKHLLRSTLLSLIGLFFFAAVQAQDTLRKPLYHPEADAAAEIAAALEKAREETKHVFVQIGGEWCIWCYRFHNFCKQHAEIDSLLSTHYIIVHVNYSSENRNLAVMEQLEFPQRFGFPVFVILDAQGKRLHTQDSGYLEDGGNGYLEKKVYRFLYNWRPEALDPAQYQPDLR